MKKIVFNFPTHTQKSRTISLRFGDESRLNLNLNSENSDAECCKRSFSIENLQDLGFMAGKQFNTAQSLIFECDEQLVSQFSEATLIQWLGLGLYLSSYRYQHKSTAVLNPTVPEIVLESIDTNLLQAFMYSRIFATAQLISRELMNLPGNVLFPESFVSAVEQLAIPNVSLSILDEQALTTEKFGGLLCISQGSETEARLLTLHYRSANAQKTIALVGKGVTFDTGGISIKAARLMSTMKFDMGGAAAVVGAMYAIAALKLPVNVIGLCGLVENMPSGSAIKPGDVVTMRSQTSVEIISTDAEGRMVLADVLDYAQEKYTPDYLIDIATLTGGAGVALGKGFAALMGNSDPLISAIKTAGKLCAEPVWHLPVGGWFNNPLECAYADLRHGSEDPHGSPCVAATFLSHFVKPQQAWAHLDIAAMAHDLPHRKMYGETASGFGALLLTHICQTISR